MSTILMHMKSETPFCFADFNDFYSKKHSAFSVSIKLEQLPEACVIGLILQYMHENAIDFSILDVNLDVILPEILATMSKHEETIKHYS